MDPITHSELEDIEDDIKTISRTLAVTPNGSPDRLMLLARLGMAYDKRFDILCDLDDNRQAIESWTRVLTWVPDDYPFMPDLLDSLATAHGQRFRHLGDIKDIDKAIEYACQALALTPDGDENLPMQLSNLVTSYTKRFEHLCQLEDLERAMEYGLRAAHTTSHDDSEFARALDNLGFCHSHRFQHLGEVTDLEKAIHYHSHAVTLAPAGDRGLPQYLGNLGLSYSDRFKRLGKLGDLKKAIRYQSRALDLTPDGHPALAARLANLGASYDKRSQRLGRLADLEKAIQYHSRAVDLTPEGHPDLSGWLSSLGISHTYRFEHLGELADIEKAIRYMSRAVDLAPSDHPSMANYLTNIGVPYIHRFKRLGELADLEHAIQYGSRAVNLTPDGHPELATRLANLGASYSDKFEHLGKLEDLKESIEYLCRAVDLSPDGHPDLPNQLSNLGTSYEARFEALGDLSDLEKAIDYQSRAISSIPKGHSHSALMHSHSAWSNFLYYQHTDDPSYLDHSLHSFRLATQSTTSAPRERFDYARRWAVLASKHSGLNPIEAFQTIIGILPQFIWLGATTSQRYDDLSTLKNLAADAAYTAILSSDSALALEWLEHARCVVWAQSVMLRSPLDQLQVAHPALATRFQSVATQLRSASSDTRESRALAYDSKNAEQVAQAHRRLAQEYDELINQVRELDGFEDFLRPTKAKSLVRAARYGPVVVLNCHADRSDALILQPGQGHVDHVPLPNFTREMANRVRFDMEMAVRSVQVKERGTTRRPVVDAGHESDFRSVLGVLWHNVIKPILSFLGYMNDVSVGSLPHITWCPTGAISFLPLHAAGDYDQTRSRVFDYVVSSYAPTLTALLESTPSSLKPDSRVLAIAQPATPGHTRLPGTVGEVMQLKAHTAAKLEYSQLTGSEATKSSVLDAMEQHDWVHLACHAHQNVSDPTKSGFFLHDEVLDLASINRRSFKNKGLAFLSACQTATGDEKLPDEAVHLASGMLMAGYSSVIATMWSVVDADAPLVADKVYSQLMVEGKLGNGEAGKALHDAVAALRNDVGEQAFGRWVPYIHVGS